MKYPRTYHLPFSQVITSDDKRMTDVSGLLNTQVVFSDKMDGSNVCLTNKECFARSHSKQPAHQSFSLLKAMHAKLKHKIPENTQVFCEYLFARHTVPYYNLPSYLMVIGVRDLPTMMWLSNVDAQRMISKIGLKMVPIVGDGSGVSIFKTEKELKDMVFKLLKIPSVYSTYKEGIVVRVTKQFHTNDFKKYVGKMVSKKFKPDKDKHWKYKKIEKNRLIK